ncbi:MAG: hypothetical protein EXS68_01430 [Candidatus Ryanbacteria bacterium]|nr:hypothetical protein [Candidatus Ryanbacteria bacterium]
MAINTLVKQTVIGQRGIAALTMMFLVLGILIVLIASYGLITANTARATTNVIQAAKAFYVAEAGVEDGLARFVRSGGNLASGTYQTTLNSGVATYIIDTVAGSSLESTSNAGGRQRRIHITLNKNQIYTYAAIVGKGGLHMADGTFIHSEAGALCQGDSEAGDAGGVYVEGDIWANGGSANSVQGVSGFDSRITGHVYTWGDVDIRPTERKEPDPNVTAKWVCIGAGSSVSATDCPIKATAIVQKVMVHHEAGYLTKRAALRVSHVGDPADANFPTTKFYPIRGAAGDWSLARRIILDKDVSSTDRRAFSQFKIDRDHNGTEDVMSSSQSEWVYFNIPSQMNTNSYGDSVFLVLQMDAPSSIPAGNANYWKVFYDESTNPDYLYSDGYGGYSNNQALIVSGVICPPSGASELCDTDPLNSDGLLDDAVPLDVAKKVDFHFRLYSLRDRLNNYTHSLHVNGELHADEALGATVIGTGSSPNNKNIGFVGRRFASTFSRVQAAHQKIWGYSIVQQLDNCDIPGGQASKRS